MAWIARLMLLLSAARATAGSCALQPDANGNQWYADCTTTPCNNLCHIVSCTQNSFEYNCNIGYVQSECAAVDDYSGDVYYYACSSYFCLAGTYLSDCGGYGGWFCGICEPCSLKPAYSTWTSATASNTNCAVTCAAGAYMRNGVCTPCPAGMYSTAVGAVTDLCTSCAYGTYAPNPGASACQPCFSTANMQTWTAFVNTQWIRCSVGYYYITSTINCDLLCLPCNAVSPPNTYYVLQQGLSSDWTMQPTACFTAQCNLQGCPAGNYLSGCHGTNPGTCAPCTSAQQSVTYYTGPGTALGDSTSCPTQACPTCSPGYSLQGCNTSPATSASPGICANCVNQLPNFAYWTTGCSWSCSQGYYIGGLGTTCVPGSDSSACGVGMYRTPADGTNDGVCTPCTNKPSSAVSVYTSYSPSNSNLCPWACTSPYPPPPAAATQYSWADTSHNQCANCSYPAVPCQVGQYVSAQCLVSSVNVAPSCLACTPVGNANLTTPGTIVNSASSCGFVCNAGFFQPTPGSRSCVPCGMCGNGSYASVACTATSNTTCAPCPPVVDPVFNTQMYYPQPNNCSNFVCLGAFQLVAGATYPCQPCVAGTYRNATGTTGSPCTKCWPGSYQPAKQGTTCLPVPQGAISTPDFTFFLCVNSSYYIYMSLNPLTLIPQYTCAPCGQLNATTGVIPNSVPAYTAWATPGQQQSNTANFMCNLSSLLCMPSYYYTPYACVSCPSLSSFATSVPLQVDGKQPYNASGNYKNMSSLQLTLAQCPFACNAGYYPYTQVERPDAQTFFQSATVAAIFQCLPCGPPVKPCGLNMFILPCPGASVYDNITTVQRNNTCGLCPVLPQPNAMVYTSTTNCSMWACAPGFVRVGPLSCNPCPAGTFTSTTSTQPQNCTPCAPGNTTWSLTGQSVCASCTPGTFASSSGSATCQLCPAGYYSSFSASACTACPANTYADSLGSSQCQPCPPQTPASPQNTTSVAGCKPPLQPCPPGFFSGGNLFLSPQGCVACPEGAYCTGGVAYLCPLGQFYSPPLATSPSACTASNVTAAWRGQSCPQNTSPAVTPIASPLQCRAPNGFYGLPGLPAAPCPIDSYCPSTGGVTISTVAIACPESAPYTATAGQFNASACTPTVSPPCPARFYQNVLLP